MAKLLKLKDKLVKITISRRKFMPSIAPMSLPLPLKPCINTLRGLLALNRECTMDFELSPYCKGSGFCRSTRV